MATSQPTAEVPLQVLRFSESEPIDNRAIADRFGKNLWRERQRASLSQEELALFAGLHRTEISMLERGIRLPRIDTLIKVAGGLECESGLLLTGMSWHPGSIRTGQFVERRQG